MKVTDDLVRRNVHAGQIAKEVAVVVGGVVEVERIWLKQGERTKQYRQSP